MTTQYLLEKLEVFIREKMAKKNMLRQADF